MKKTQGIIKDDDLVAEDSLIADGSLEKADRDTQLKKQSVEIEAASMLTWMGTFILRSIILYFSMEYVKAWWKKFKEIYFPKKIKIKVKEKEVENAIIESIPTETEEPET